MDLNIKNIYLLLYYQNRKPNDIVELFRAIEPAEEQKAKELWPNEMCNCGHDFFSCHARWVMSVGADDKIDYLEETVKFIEQYG